MLPANFSGIAPLFPLPNLVFFPATVQPLHIFEPRYRQMMQDTLRGEMLMALATLQEGWQRDYFGNPAIHPVVTLGRVQGWQELPDGRFNLVLAGLTRARVAEELSGRPYRRGRLEILGDLPVDPGRARALQHEVLEAFRLLLQPASPQELLVMTDPGLGLGELCDRLASLLPLPPEAKLRLLEERDPARRGDLLIGYLGRLAETLRNRVAPVRGASYLRWN
ncbi:MAG TPA: LON peptidase substrate-binding domain-containing protein [Candidatus Nitrosotenuis sp.]|jgi:Lon protease-like protein|nr:LON peptidase substrate-binding domain-containing protein [Candidatus Nitrosotenuis sp.]